MMEEIEKIILADPGTFFPRREAPRRLGTLLVKGSLGANAGRVTFLVFRDEETAPSLAVKIARAPAGESLLAAEASGLRFLAEKLSAGVNSAAPKLLHEGNCLGAAFIAEEAVGGIPLGAEMAQCLFSREKKASALLLEASSWLGRLARESGRPADGEKKAVPAAEKFRTRYPLSAGAARFLDGLKADLECLDRECRRVFVHGDFSPMNIYFGEGGLRVIDWAESFHGGMPLHDLFFLLTCSVAGAGPAEEEGTRRLDNFSSLFLREGARSELARAALKRVSNGLDLREGMLRPLLALFLMERANLEYDVLERQGQSGYMLPLRPFGENANWSDGSLLRCGLYGRLFERIAANSDRLIF
ncbi:MAG TPA: hypothetical protein DCZ93_08240 [Elusimicrobia bacterium]|nr:hypothetical protein [Elusimicrobiota bacterium]